MSVDAMAAVLRLRHLDDREFRIMIWIAGHTVNGWADIRTSDLAAHCGISLVAADQAIRKLRKRRLELLHLQAAPAADTADAGRPAQAVADRWMGAVSFGDDQP